MSSPRVFKKRAPKTAVCLSNGKFVLFEDVGSDLGFHVTEDPQVILEFETCMKVGRGGVENSTMDEYQEAIKKKTPYKPSSSKLIREEQTAGLVTTPAIPVAVASPVASDAELAQRLEVKLTPIAPPEPKVGKRAK